MGGGGVDLPSSARPNGFRCSHKAAYTHYPRGLFLYFSASDTPQSWLDLAYLAFQMFPFNLPLLTGSIPWQLQLARFAAPAIVAYTAVAAGLAIFKDQVQLLRARRMAGHVIVCGLGAKGELLVANLCVAGRRVVVIEQNESRSSIGKARAEGAVVIVGDATDPGQLLDAGLYRATHLVAACGHDGTNAEVAVRARELMTAHGVRPLTCIAHVTDPHLAELLQRTEISGQRLDRFRLEFFNVFELGARSLLTQHSPFSEIGPGNQASSHVLIVGLGHLGSAVAAEAARR